MTEVTLSLAKANKLRNILEDKILRQLEADLTSALAGHFLGVEKTVSDVAALRLKRRDEAKMALERIEVAQDAASTLRILIAAKNAEVGINSLLISQARLKRELATARLVLNSLSGSERDLTDEQYFDLIVQARESFKGSDSLYRRSMPTVNFVVNGDQFTYDEAKNKVETIERSLRELEEDRNELNYSHTVTLDEKTTTALRSFGLL